MKRRDFLQALGATALLPGPLRALAARSGGAPRQSGPGLLIPMDESQTNHLKAYGITFRSLGRGRRAEWLLNYRGGSYLLEADAASRREAALQGVLVEEVSTADVVNIRGTVAASNMDAIPLEKAPKVAVYAPPNAPPWDDAVTMALEYAGIEYDRIWDPQVLRGHLSRYEWLHLHHEDFTGQYSNVAELKKAVAGTIRRYVQDGGFLFAMCTATETLELALAAEGVDIAAQFSDGTPMDPTAAEKLRWERSFAFQDASLELSPAVASFSDIDGHQVNNPALRQPLGAFQLFDFSAKIDPVATMLVQCHRDVIPDFYGLTTSFRRSRLKPSVTVLADEQGAGWVKYIHGEYGSGTWTYLGGHDPEDPQHQIGDPPTDLSLHPGSPGYRLILNNVLFPAAKKRELKT
jgi:hypothetical protein